MRAVSQALLQKTRQVEFGNQRLEFEIRCSEPLVELQKVAFVVFRRVNSLRAAVGEQSHQEIEMRGRRPRRIGPAALYLTQTGHRFRHGTLEGIEPATVQDHKDVVVVRRHWMLPTGGGPVRGPSARGISELLLPPCRSAAASGTPSRADTRFPK